MPGAMIGIFGKQRSGKTLLGYRLCKSLLDMSAAEGIYLPVYSNIFTKDKRFIYINSLERIPLNLDPKVIFIDEIYNGCDAQDYKQLKEISIFINTLGKQNCLFVFTSIDASMVYNRIRNQMNAVVFVKGDKSCIYYKMVMLDSMKEYNFITQKNEELFRSIDYDTNFIPPVFNWSMKSWQEKLNDYYTKYFTSNKF